MRFQVRLSAATVVLFRFRETAEEFAKAMGLHPNTVQEIER